MADSKISKLPETSTASDTNSIAMVDVDVSTTKKITRANFLASLANLTDDEISELENIGSNTITNTQWGYLGGLDQALSTTDNPSFATEVGIGTGTVDTNMALQIEADGAYQKIKNTVSGSAAGLFLDTPDSGYNLSVLHNTGWTNADDQFSIRTIANGFYGLSIMRPQMGVMNVGINKDDPAYNLDVDGDCNLESGGVYRIAGSQIDSSDLVDGQTVKTKTVSLKPIAEDASLSTGDNKMKWVVPASIGGMDLVDADAHVFTASSSGTPTIQIHNATDTVDMLSTRITIDASEKDSSTAATQPSIDTANDDVAEGDEIRIDVDAAGTDTTGLEVRLSFR